MGTQRELTAGQSCSQSGGQSVCVCVRDNRWFLQLLLRDECGPKKGVSKERNQSDYLNQTDCL